MIVIGLPNYNELLIIDKENKEYYYEDNNNNIACDFNSENEKDIIKLLEKLDYKELL